MVFTELIDTDLRNINSLVLTLDDVSNLGPQDVDLLEVHVAALLVEVERPIPAGTMLL